MPTAALPNAVDGLRAMVDPDATLAPNRKLSEENNLLRHLLRQLQYGRGSERLDHTSWRWKTLKADELLPWAWSYDGMTAQRTAV
jgi:hypothetical protein